MGRDEGTEWVEMEVAPCFSQITGCNPGSSSSNSSNNNNNIGVYASSQRSQAAMFVVNKISDNSLQ